MVRPTAPPTPSPRTPSPRTPAPSSPNSPPNLHESGQTPSASSSLRRRRIASAVRTRQGGHPVHARSWHFLRKRLQLSCQLVGSLVRFVLPAEEGTRAPLEGKRPCDPENHMGSLSHTEYSLRRIGSFSPTGYQIRDQNVPCTWDLRLQSTPNHAVIANPISRHSTQPPSNTARACGRRLTGHRRCQSAAAWNR